MVINVSVLAMRGVASGEGL